MQGIIVKRNRRNNIPENKQRVFFLYLTYFQELDDECDFLSQCLIRIIDLKNHYDQCIFPPSLSRSKHSRHYP